MKVIIEKNGRELPKEGTQASINIASAICSVKELKLTGYPSHRFTLRVSLGVSGDGADIYIRDERTGGVFAFWSAIDLCFYEALSKMKIDSAVDFEREERGPVLAIEYRP